MDEHKILEYLRKEYSKSLVEKERRETDHLPFPFISEKLEKSDLNIVESDFSKFVVQSFSTYQDKWENKKEDMDNFSRDLDGVSDYLSNFQLLYPCYILNNEDFDYNSEKVNSLYHDMRGFIFAYFFLFYSGPPKENLSHWKLLSTK
ncbi:MAG: hypothetical protein HRU40_22345 [Saprospiraceae bacterium]|nr:hypothetical protein [Saprospiraceae bacterium]